MTDGEVYDAARAAGDSSTPGPSRITTPWSSRGGQVRMAIAKQWATGGDRRAFNGDILRPGHPCTTSSAAAATGPRRPAASRCCTGPIPSMRRPADHSPPATRKPPPVKKPPREPARRRRAAPTWIARPSSTRGGDHESPLHQSLAAHLSSGSACHSSPGQRRWSMSPITPAQPAR
jgi:hypothetical protein